MLGQSSRREEKDSVDGYDQDTLYVFMKLPIIIEKHFKKEKNDLYTWKGFYML